MGAQPTLSILIVRVWLQKPALPSCYRWAQHFFPLLLVSNCRCIIFSAINGVCGVRVSHRHASIGTEIAQEAYWLRLRAAAPAPEAADAALGLYLMKLLMAPGLDCRSCLSAALSELGTEVQRRTHPARLAATHAVSPRSASHCLLGRQPDAVSTTLYFARIVAMPGNL